MITVRAMMTLMRTTKIILNSCLKWSIICHTHTYYSYDSCFYNRHIFDLQSVSNELASSKADLQSHISSNDALSKQLQTNSDSNNDIHNQLAKLQKDNDKLQNDKDENERVIMELQNELLELRQDREEAEATFEERQVRQ